MKSKTARNFNERGNGRRRTKVYIEEIILQPDSVEMNYFWIHL